MDKVEILLKSLKRVEEEHKYGGQKVQHLLIDQVIKFIILKMNLPLTVYQIKILIDIHQLEIKVK